MDNKVIAVGSSQFDYLSVENYNELSVGNVLRNAWNVTWIVFFFFFYSSDIFTVFCEQILQNTFHCFLQLCRALPSLLFVKYAKY